MLTSECCLLPLNSGYTLWTFIIVNGLIVHNGELNDVCYSMEHSSVLIQWMPVYIRQAAKALKHLLTVL